MSEEQEVLILSSELDILGKGYKKKQVHKLESLLLDLRISKDYEKRKTVNETLYLDCLNSLNPNSKLLCMSSLDLECDEHAELEQGIDDFLVSKPYKYVPKVMDYTSTKYLKLKKVIESDCKDKGVLTMGITQGVELRVMYYEGNLVSAKLRGGTGLGKDVTDSLIGLLGDSLEIFQDYALVELRGVLTLKGEHKGLNVVKDVINLLNSELKTSESELLFIVSNLLCNDLKDLDIVDRLTLIDNIGKESLITPIMYEGSLTDQDLKSCIMELKAYFSEDDDYIMVNNIVTLDIFSRDGEDLYFTLPMGKSSKKNILEGVVKYVTWVNDLSIKRPKIVFKEPIIVSDAVTIKDMVLNSPATLLILGVDVGNSIYFVYDDLLGVTPVTTGYDILVNGTF